MSELQKVPSFFAGLQFQARLNPDAMAIVTASRNLTYGEFCLLIERVTARLASMELPAGIRVAVQVHDEIVRWLTLAALARIGVLSATVISETEQRSFKPREVITDQTGPSAPGVIRIGADWLDPAADSLPRFKDQRFEHDTPCRVVLSSGTTGVPKKAVLTYGGIYSRVRASARAYGLNATARLAPLMGTGTVAGYTTPVTCWSSGGAVLFSPLKPGQSMPDLMRLNPNVLFMSPAQLAAMVESLPATTWPSRRPTVYVAGSELTADLSRRTRLKLTQSLFIIYGSTEAGLISMAHAASAEGRPGFSGFVAPTAEVEIVDEQGQPVTTGTVGEIRVRADGMVKMYLDDPDSSAEMFRDGWFYPGDAGMLTDDHALVLKGRTREIMNVNGDKVSPAELDEALAGVDGVKDLAVFGLPTPTGTQPAAAVVTGPGFDVKKLGQRYRDLYPKLPRLIVAEVPSIPRNQMGKVMRTELATSMRAALDEQERAAAAKVKPLA